MTQHDDDLVAVVRAALAENSARVQRLEHRGQFVWVKRREVVSLRRRLQKGDPAAAFEAERRALHDWRRMAAPAPAILTEASDFIALADCGQPLDRLLTTPHTAPLTLPFRAAGAALAGLHARSISHGRPSLKDICWDGARITFLDLERYHPRRNTPGGHAQDVVMFVFSGIVTGRGMTPELQAAIDSYRAADADGIWQMARDWCHRMRWINWATRPIQWRGEGKALEFKAIPQTLATFAAAGG